jgi:putative transposase
LGLIGPVPARVDANTKAALLTLVDDAVAGGLSARRVCALVAVNPLRIARWRARAAVDALVDRVARVSPVHTLLAWEVAAVLTLARDWGDVDRSHRKLAHRGSYLRLVWVSPSTIRRVLAAHGVTLAGRPPRPKPERKPLPAWLDYRPRQLWIWDVERHEALLDRAVVKGRRLWALAGAW